MTILAIDTSSAWCSVALLFNDGRFDLKHEELGSQSSKFLLPWIDELMSRNNLSWSSIHAIAVSQGPGAFTGVRLGIGVAQGLAFANDKPLVPVASLDGVAFCQYFTRDPKWLVDGKIVVALDARMDQVYWATYQTSSKDLPHRIGGIELSAPLDINVNEVNAVVGNASDIYPGQIQVKEAVILDNRLEVSPNALGIAFGAKQLVNYSGCDAAGCQPLYIRDKVAQTIAERNLSKIN
jgi:tRNA threonylcarbamoyladenosine biosynthesis protein TsaB